MTNNELDLSIIVASYNTVDYLRNCLQSIYQTTENITFEVIVVDDCSTDDSARMVTQEFKQAILICNKQNLRYTKTNNLGLSVAKGRYALLLNSDVIVQKNAFSRLVYFMDSHPDAAAAGPKLINPDGSTQLCVRGFPSWWPMLLHTLGFHKMFPGNRFTKQYYYNDFDYNKTQLVDSIGTTAFIIRRSIWEKFGVLDERFSLSFVDLAYCLMLKQHKQKVYFVSDAVVIHYGNVSISLNGEKEIRRMYDSLRVFYDCYLANEHSVLFSFIIRVGIKLKMYIRLISFKFRPNQKVFEGLSAHSGKIKHKL